MPSKINEGLLNNEFARETMGEGKVYAIEKKTIAAELIYKNIEKNNKNLLFRGENHHTFAPQKNKKIR